MNRSIDLNADLGEGADNDALLLPLVSSVNIACGGHAGDEKTMRRTIRAAMAAGIAIGAHPGYDDRANFGRRPLSIEPEALRDSIRTQLDRFLRIADDCGASLHHVKPHGALYHQADKDPQLASLFVACITEIQPACRIYCPPHGELAPAAARAGLHVAAEGFADRRYQDNGNLVPRDLPGAVLTIPSEAAAQAIRIACHGSVTTDTGTCIPLLVRTLCVHGDSPQAAALLQAVRTALENADIRISAREIG
jgi:UPF0271 protein